MKKITKSVVLAVLSALLVFGCKNSVSGGEKDLNDDVSLENGKKDGNDDVPFENGKYISAIGTSEGIKITFADNVSVKAYNSISVDGIPIRIDTSPDDENYYGKTYIFPFAEKGKTYVVTYSGGLIVNGVERWVEESVECVAGGGLRYTDYLNIDSLDNYSLTVSYNGPNYPGGMFSGEFKPSFSKNDVIKNNSIFNDFTFGYSVVLGELHYEHTRYWSWAHDVTTWGNSNIFDELALSQGFDFVSGDCEVPTEQNWREYDYKYAAYVTPIFSLKNYSNTVFKLEKDLWSAQKTYDPSAGVETKPNGKYITAESTGKGIKITVINDAFKISDCSFVGMDDGVEFPLRAMIEHDAREFVFPFTEPGKKYYITVACYEENGDSWNWKQETVSCVAGGGIDYKQYIDPFSDSSLSINYNASDEEYKSYSYFEMKLINLSLSNSVISGIQSLNFRYMVSFEQIGVEILIGDKDFMNDKDVACEAIIPMNDEERSRYDGYQYTGCMTPYLTLRDYPDITFELPTVWSEQKTYTPSN